jgi:hypothetical protein
MKFGISGNLDIAFDTIHKQFAWIANSKHVSKQEFRRGFANVENYLIQSTLPTELNTPFGIKGGKSDPLESKIEDLMNLTESMYVLGDYILKYGIKPARKIKLFKPEILSQMIQFYIQGMWKTNKYKEIYMVVPTFECLTANWNLRHFWRPIQGLFEIIKCSIFLPF